MKQLPLWKIFLTFFVCLFGIFFALPNFLSTSTLEKMPNWLPKDKVSLGLDLQGGSHILLEVDITTAIKDKYTDLADFTRSTLRKNRIGYQALRPTPTQISFRLRKNTPDIQDKVYKILGHLNNGKTTVNIDKNGFVKISFTPENLKETKQAILNQSIEIVRRRIDETGTKEPAIQQQGEDRIVLQLPGVDDPATIKNLLGQTAKLAFKMVDHSVSPEDIRLGNVPRGTEILNYIEKTGMETPPKIAVRKTATITGDMLVDSQPGLDQQYNRPIVTFKFNNLGAKKFAEATRKNIGKQFAIVLDEKVISAPVINSVIPHGDGFIQGKFTVQETQDLSLLLRAGALPAPLKVLEERTVGPGLGADSIRSGEKATIYAIILVSLFMLLAYAFFGVVADIAVIFNIILLIAGLSLLQATLTLPGIAGIALTIGMAVDANVLIYERIKEELAKGRNYMFAIDAGYKRAMTTILDSNLTTLIGALFLYQFGTGPVRGFAVTLALGIIISMFTAITLTRVIAIAWLSWRKPKKLSI